MPLPGKVMFINIPKKIFLYSPMILLLLTYPQKLFHPPGPKQLNNIWKKKQPKLHLPSLTQEHTHTHSSNLLLLCFQTNETDTNSTRYSHVVTLYMYIHKIMVNGSYIMEMYTSQCIGCHESTIYLPQPIDCAL